jgi:CDP-glycerol glycerophosphotransferase (TagB/SpsB family)
MKKKIANLITQISFPCFNFLFQLIAVFYKPSNTQAGFFFRRKTFSDNDRYVFEALHKHGKYTCYCFIRDKELFKEVSYIYPSNTVYFYSMKGIIVFIKTGIVFTSFGIQFFPYLLNVKFKKVINLWHGTPIKYIGQNISKKGKLIKNAYTNTLCNSDFEKLILSSSFNQPLNDFWLIGSLRHDEILKSNNLNIINKYLDKNVILYAPTFRGNNQELRFFPFDEFDLLEFDQFLGNNNCVLILRTHPNDRTSSKNLINNTVNIINGNNEVFPDIQHLLSHTDLLVTDYSSIYLDFLIKNKPMIMLPYDLADYKKERGLFFDIDTFFPGPTIYKYPAFKDYITKALIDPTIDADRREFVSKVFHYHQDGNTMERLIAKLSEIN